MNENKRAAFIAAGCFIGILTWSVFATTSAPWWGGFAFAAAFGWITAALTA